MAASLLKAAQTSPVESVSAETPASTIAQFTPLPAATQVPTQPARNAAKDDGPKWTDKLSAYSALAGAILGAVATIAAAVSAFFSLRTVRQADATERERARSAKAERFSNLWSEITDWEFLSKADLAQPENPAVAEKVRKDINSMGKVGFWWQADLIDHEFVAKEIAPTYVTLFEQISKVGHLPALRRTGQDLIDENPSATILYHDLKKYLAAHPPAVAANPHTTPNPQTSP